MPGTGKICSDGFSFGVKRKNSRLPLYHFIEYRVSPSKSYWQIKFTFSPRLTAAGTSTFTSFSVKAKSGKWEKFFLVRLEMSINKLD